MVTAGEWWSYNVIQCHTNSLNYTKVIRRTYTDDFYSTYKYSLPWIVLLFCIEREGAREREWMNVWMHQSIHQWLNESIQAHSTSLVMFACCVCFWIKWHPVGIDFCACHLTARIDRGNQIKACGRLAVTCHLQWPATQMTFPIPGSSKGPCFDVAPFVLRRGRVCLGQGASTCEGNPTSQGGCNVICLPFILPMARSRRCAWASGD